jgi:hypothetical protein
MRPDRVCIALLLGVVACSGATPATFAVDSGSHGQTGPEAAPIEMEAESPVDATVTGDEPTVEIEASAGDDAAIESGTAIDASDDAGIAPSLCSRICTGCCDAMGKCRTGNTTALCGGTGAGAACSDCSTNKCPLTEAPCCGSKGCGCAVAGLIGCN